MPGYMPARDFELKLGAKGWLGLSWPREYGGGGQPVSHQFIVEEEVALHGGPASDAIARIIVAPILLLKGSEEHKRRFLPALARGEITFCLGYTEPESGSDLASLQTRAADGGYDQRPAAPSGRIPERLRWLAARTEADAQARRRPRAHRPPHRGIGGRC
jgi:alkylation response protein AidB-like acyl-CoA dehydrogenase